MLEQIYFRKLDLADSQAYRQIRLEALKYHPESFGSSFDDQQKLPKLMFQIAFEKPLDCRFVMGALDHDNLVGICGFVPEAGEYFPGLENTGSLIQMYIKPEYRGRKIGLSLVLALIKEVFQLPGINKIVLGVKKENTAAIQVYSQAGFQRYQPDHPDEDRTTPGTLKYILYKPG